MNSPTTELAETEARLDRQLAYGILRLTLGINILVHGLLRLSQLASFADGLVQAFAKTLVGLLLTLGLWTRFALVGGGLLIIALLFGTALRSDWDTLGIQMIYAAIYYVLLANRTHDRFLIDHLVEKIFVHCVNKAK